MSLLSRVRAVLKARNRRLFVPEVLQTSMMDCGPATLKSVFDGFGRPMNLDRLRERCQTDVDGTSLAALHDTANRLGLDTMQIMVPKDSLLLPEASCLPAIVFLVNPDGLLHFVTVWSKLGGFVQVMDPGRGRVWLREDDFIRSVATPALMLPEAKWRAWAGGDDFARPLMVKLREVGFGESGARALLDEARMDPTPKGLAALDAATRMTRSLISSGALSRGSAARSLLERSFRSDAVAVNRTIPPPYWICDPAPMPGRVMAKGAVLLTIDGVRPETTTTETTADGNVRTTRMGDMPKPTDLGGVLARASVTLAAVDLRAADVRASRLSSLGNATDAFSVGARMGTGGGADTSARQSMWAGPVVPTEVLSELRAPTVRPHRIFASLLWEDSRSAVITMSLLAVIGVVTGILDAVLMRGVSETLGRLNLVSHRMVALGAVLLFLVLALGLELAQAGLVQRLARGLEARLRVAFLEKLPRLEDKYFRSRPVSDMASRAHLLQTLRGVPRFAMGLLSGVLQLIATTGAIVWLEPKLGKLAGLLLLTSLALPVVSYRLLDEALSRQRIHGAALYRFYLDSLLGIVPIRVHGAERSIRREHEALLTEWVSTARSVETRTVSIMAVERLMGAFIAGALVVTFVRSGGDLRALLLLTFFAQKLPGQAEGLVKTMRAWPLLKHDALRLFEPLAAAEADGAHAPLRRVKSSAEGVTIVFKDVTAVAGGREIVSRANVSIPRGAHVAIVGASGAGKSSLVSILLGWLFVTDGRVLIDGRPLDGVRLNQLRQETAWVDPSIQLWNGSLLDNLLYGHGEEALSAVEDALVAGDLLDVVQRMPNGLQSPLGESGARVSGGQGQRVRLGRALLRPSARLAILDEPFRGLERDKRREMLRRSREIWRSATMLFVSHDVGDTLAMDRVLVVEGGRIVEDGTPAELLSRDSAYRKLVEGDRSAMSEVWARPEWRRHVLVNGKLESRSNEEAS